MASVRRRLAGLLAVALAVAPVAACAEAEDLGPQPTPQSALRAYLRVLELKVKEPDLTLYTPETRRLLAAARVSNRQMELELGSLRGVIESMDVRRQGDLAVVRFAAQQRVVPPYFFRHGAGGWMLDLATASRVIVFGQGNEWRFRTRDHDYAFAFDD